MTRFILQRRRALSLAVCALLVAQTILPIGLAFGQDGANVVAGGASITQDGSTLNIVTQSDRTVINWNSFNIEAGHTTNFLQPSAQSAVLNRVVTANNPSLIYGNLNSNGNVLLVNPSGILIGPTGVINTNGFIASVHDIPDLEFLEGGSLQFRGDSIASVINQGNITTGPGGAALIGGDVINEGTITSYGGSISLVSGGSVTLADGSRFTHADLGTIEMGLSPYAGVIQNSGTIRATGAVETGGEVYLVNPGGKIMHDGTIAALREMQDGTTNGGIVSVDASQGGETTIGGDIDVAGDEGGSVTIEADAIALTGANIDATGSFGGGNINIGGGLRGNDPSITNALTTSVDANSSLRADAFELGNGGEIIIYSNDSTVYSGYASANGGMLGGDGGFVEVSGDYVMINGGVELGSTMGQGGTLLIDPTDVCVAFDMATCPPGSSFVDIDALVVPFLSGPGVNRTLIIQTSGGGLGDGDIHVVDPIATTTQTTSSTSLVLRAHDDVVIDGAISDAGNGLNLSFQVDIDGTGGGRIRINESILTNNGDLSMTGDDYRINSNIDAGTGTINFARATQGRIGLGFNNSSLATINSTELGRLTADTINIGAPITPNLTSSIFVHRVDLTSIPNVNFYTAGTTRFSGDNQFDSISTNGGASYVFNGGTLAASDVIQFNTPLVLLNGNLTATNGISGLASTVNVLGSSRGAELQDAVDLSIVGATVNVAAGSYDGFEIDKENLIVNGIGSRSVVMASSPAITIAANGVTVQNMLLQGTGSIDDVGILLDGIASPQLTGINIVNVDFSNLDDGITSQGNIGTGIVADVTIRGNSAADPAIFEDFLGSAIFVRDFDNDANYVVQDVVVRDGSSDMNSIGTGDHGMRFGAVGGVTLQRVDISGARGNGVQFAALNDSVVNVLDSSIQGALDSSGFANGIRFSGTISNGSEVTIAGNTQIVSNGGRHGISFDREISGSTTTIDIANNTSIRSVEGAGIFFNRSVSDATIIVRGNGSNTSNGIVSRNDAFAMNNGSVGFVNANVLIGGDSASDGNFITSTNAQSIDVERISGGTFTVANNTLRTGASGSLNIEFERAIVNGATVQIVNNPVISGGRFGISFLREVTDSNLIIAGNGISTANTANASGILINALAPVTDSNVTIGSANVVVDGTVIAAGGNTISNARNGIYVRGTVNGDSNVNITDNLIGSSGSPLAQDGIYFENGILDTATVTIGGANQVFANGHAIRINDLQSPSTLSITGGTYTGMGGALLVDNTGVAGSDGRLNIGSAAFSTAGNGSVIEVLTDTGNAGVDIDFSGTATIDGGATGLRLSGPGIDILNDSLGSIAFTNQSSNYIELANGAEFQPGTPTIIDASSVTFDGLTGLAMTPAQLLAIEDMIVHFPDDSSLGLIDISPLFVVQGESIQTAVNFAGGLVGPQTVFVGNGTFGGSVEVWVDDLTLLGNGVTTIIDTSAVDPFANNGDVNNGFQVVARSFLSGFGNVSGVTIDAFRFDTPSTGNGNVGIELGVVGFPFSNAANTTLQNLSINDVRDGIIANRVTGSTTISNVTMTSISQQGIDFLLPLGGDDTIRIEDSNISSRFQSIRFLTPVLGSDIDIAGNTLSSTFVDTIQFLGPLVDADVLIGGQSPANGNQMVAGRDAIGVASITNGSFTVANNSLIQGFDDGIDIRGPVSFATVSIAGNTEIRGRDEGILFDGNVLNSFVTISGNAGIYGDGRDAIRFDNPISASIVNIGPSFVAIDGGLAAFGGNAEIIGADDGINIDEIIFSSVSVLANSTIQGVAGSGIEFDDAIQNGLVVVSANETIQGGEEGIEFDTTIDDSIVLIQANANILGDTSDAIQFKDAIDNSQIVIGSAIAALGNGNINGFTDGIEFEGPITGSNTTVRIVNNDLINGGVRGVVFDNTIDDALVIVRANTVQADTIDSLLFNDTLTNANVVVVGNELSSNSGEGIDVEIISGGTFTVFNNNIMAGGDGIEFESDIVADALVNVRQNTILAGGHGMHFEPGSSILDTATVNLIDNEVTVTGGGSSGILVRNIGSLNPVTIRGGSIEGGLFGINVIQQPETEVDGNVVVDGVVVNNALGAGLIFTNTDPINRLGVTLQNTVTIHGGASSMDKGIVFSGPNLSLAGDTFNDTQLLGINGNFIELRNGALFEPGRPTLLDATGVNFDGLDPTIENEFTEITTRIIDFIDDPTLGLVFPGAPDLNPNLTYDRYTRYEDYFRTVGSLLGPNSGTIRYRAPVIDVAEELQP